MRTRGALRSGLFATAAALATIAGCALPTRDNPNDPGNSPTARLSVIDFTSSTGACVPDFASGTIWPAVSVSSRSRCLALDARASFDPVRPGATLHYSFSVVSSSGVATPLAAGSGSSAAVVVLGNAIAQLPLRTPITFRVEVGDGVGTSRADALLLLVNDLPFSVAGAPQTFPSGGYRWAPGVPFQVRFRDGGSFDPDHDTPLVYCWQLPGVAANTCSTDPLSPLFVRPISPTEGRSVGRLLVEDGDPSIATRTHPSFAQVRVRKPNLFSGGGVFGAASFAQIDVTGSVVGPTGASTIAGAAVPLDRSAAQLPPRVALLYTVPSFPKSETFLGLASAEGSAPLLSSVSLGSSGAGALTAAPDGGSVRVYVPTPMDQTVYPPIPLGPPTVRTFTVGANDLFSELPPATLPSELGYPMNTVAQAEDAHGQLWMAFRLDSPVPYERSGLLALPAGASSVAFASTSDSVVVNDLAIRPGSDEVWALRAPSASGLIDGVAASAVVFPGGAATATTSRAFSFPAGAFPTSFAWWTHDRLWVLLANDALYLVDADAWTNGAAFTDSTLLRIPDQDFASPGIGLHPRVDPVLGTCLVRGIGSDGGTKVFRVEVDGRVAASPAATSGATGPGFDPLFITTDGSAWMSAPGGFYRGAATTPDGTLGAHLFPSVRGRFLADGSLGGVLAVEQLSPLAMGLSRFAEDGTRVQSWSVFADTAGNPVLLPPIANSTLSPDGETYWFATVTGYAAGTPIDIHRIDLTTVPPTISATLFRAYYDPAHPIPLPGQIDPIFAASAPVAGTGPFAWIRWDDPGPPRRELLGVIGSAGGFSNVFEIPSNESSGNGSVAAVGSLVARDDSLCVLSNTSQYLPPLHYYLRHMTRTGTVDLWGDQPIFTNAPTTINDRVAGFDDGTNDQCWTAITEESSAPGSAQLKVQAWVGPSTVAHSVVLPVPGRIISFAVVGPDEAWAQIFDSASNTSQNLHLQFAATTTGATATFFAPTNKIGLINDDANF